MSVTAASSNSPQPDGVGPSPASSASEAASPAGSSPAAFSSAAVSSTAGDGGRLTFPTHRARPRPDYRLYLVTSGHDRHTVDVAAQVAAAGAGVVQVRAKDISARELIALTVAVRDAVRAVGPHTWVVVDDRVDVAYAAGADGVHVGQDDVPPHIAREILGPEALIGLTTGTVELAAQAQAYHLQHPGVLDYVGAGPFRPTPTKDSGRAPLGVEGYGPVVAATTLPVVAIGDVTPEDVPALSTTGIAGVAMVRSLMSAADPGARAAQALAGWAGPPAAAS